MAYKTVACPKCGQENEAPLISDSMPKGIIALLLKNFRCANCNENLEAPLIEQVNARDTMRPAFEMNLTPAELLERARRIGDWTRVPAELLAREASSILLTTTATIPGHEVERVLNIISAECAYGMNIFRDLFVGVRDIFGGRSQAIQKAFRDARITCLNELRCEALIQGADAVIGVKLDYNEISGGGKGGLLFLVASGTAVKLQNARD